MQIPCVHAYILAVNSAHFIALLEKSPPMAETTPVMLSPEQMAEIEKKNELRLKIKEEHLAALQFEGSGGKQRWWCFSVKSRPMAEQPTMDSSVASNCVCGNTEEAI